MQVILLYNYFNFIEHLATCLCLCVYAHMCMHAYVCAHTFVLYWQVLI